MPPTKLSLKIIEKYKTCNPFLIADKAGVLVEFGSWHPISHGEFDKRTKKITINLQSPIEKEEILAHELGHFFIDEFKMTLSKNEEEKYVEEFVRNLFSKNIFQSLNLDFQT